MNRPRLLDLFCGAGGAAMGYHKAGFDVVGVDIKPQPHYPFEFHQADAMTFPLEGYDAIHASPPCQAYTAYRRSGRVGQHPELIEPTRLILQSVGIPFVMENVAGAPLDNALMICGTMFDPPMEIQRHRFFESNIPLNKTTWGCRHCLNGENRYPGGRSKIRYGNSNALVRQTIEIGTWKIPLAVQSKAMGIDWMRLEELSQAIPPAYTEFIGKQLLRVVTASD